MDLIKEFEEWLVSSKRIGSKLSASSAYKYAHAIKKVSDDMIKIGLFDESFYITYSFEELDRHIKRIKKTDFFNRKNMTGHNMYSVALDHYLNFMRAR